MHSLNDMTGAPATTASARPRGTWRAITALRYIGPGIVTGASDDDPSGIGTYAMAGAALGYASLWTAPFTFPLMAAIQYICAKIGLVGGGGIAGVLRRHYSRGLLYPVVLGLVIANTINAAADIAAVAAGINLLIPLPATLLVVVIGMTILGMQVWGSYRLIARIFKWLTLSLLAYIASSFFAHPDWSAVFRATVIPTVRLDSDFLSVLVAILGTTISPYLFFWQASHESEEKASASRGHKWWRRRGASETELEYAFWDVNLGMFLSNVVMFFIILATAATLNRAGRTEIATATEAAEALRPLAGNAAFVLMALGLIGAGVLAIPILTGSGAYAVAEAFGWRCSLDDRPGRAPEFYIVMAASTATAVALDLLGINPFKALFWTAVINGFVAPPLMVVIMLISNDRAIMGPRVNGQPLNALGCAATAVMFAAAAALVVSWCKG
jgi:NRAMP (natural resistance-associated macrophage protein)-like metal ion transporter